MQILHFEKHRESGKEDFIELRHCQGNRKILEENVNEVIKETIVRYFGFKVRDSSASSDRLRSNPRANESE